MVSFGGEIKVTDHSLKLSTYSIYCTSISAIVMQLLPEAQTWSLISVNMKVSIF